MNTICAAGWTGAVIGGGICVALAWQGSASAAAKLDQAEMELRNTVALIRELSTLPATVMPNPSGTPRPNALQPRIAAVLQSCALPATSLSTLTPQAETVMASSDAKSVAYRRRTTLVLQGLILPGLGKFLATWRSMEPTWVIANIDLSPSGNAPTGGNLPLRAVLVLETVVVDRKSDPPAPPSAGPLGVEH